MGEYILLAVVLLLALYGCAQGVGRIVSWIWKPRPDLPAMVILPVSGHREDVEFIVRGAAVRYRWAAGKPHGRILLMDAGMDEETRRLAKAVCGQIPEVDFCEGTVSGWDAGAFQA